MDGAGQLACGIPIINRPLRIYLAPQLTPEQRLPETGSES